MEFTLTENYGNPGVLRWESDDGLIVLDIMPAFQPKFITSASCDVDGWGKDSPLFTQVSKSYETLEEAKKDAKNILEQLARKMQGTIDTRIQYVQKMERAMWKLHGYLRFYANRRTK